MSDRIRMDGINIGQVEHLKGELARISVFAILKELKSPI